jgi:hypothetical protein
MAELLFLEHPWAWIADMFMTQYSHKFALVPNWDVQHGADAQGRQIVVNQFGGAWVRLGVGRVDDAMGA